MRPLLDRVLRIIAWLAMLGWYRSIETIGMPRVPSSGPALVVAPHFNGFVDPALLAATLPRLPRFLAMARLWKNPVARPLLALAGAVPVHRASDGSTGGNVGTFEECHEVLRTGGVIAIFPEGRVNEKLHLLPLKTGAARIALGGRAAGAVGIAVVPVGLVFEDRTAVRSRVVVHVGPPIDLDGEIGSFVLPGESAGQDNHMAEERLTAAVGDRLRAASPDFRHADEALVLRDAAGIALRPPGADPRWEAPLGQIEEVAQGLDDAPAPARSAVIDATRRYQAELNLPGLRDEQVVPGNTRKRFLVHHRAAEAKLLAVAPFAAVGGAVNAAPTLLVWLVGRRPMARVSRGNAKLLASLPAYPATWVGCALLLRRRGVRHPWLAAVAAGPGCGFATMYALERWTRFRRAEVGWEHLARHFADDRTALAHLRERRSDLVAGVRAAESPSGP